MASYFDIVFAVNREYHPGEKRLLAQAAHLPMHPSDMVDDLTKACSTACDLENCVAHHLKNTREKLASWMQAQGFETVKIDYRQAY
jgi:hypothetical protein